MSIVNGLDLGWTGQPSRRARQPAAPKPVNSRKSVKPTPRGKYGLAPRRERLEHVGQEEGADVSTLPSSSSGKATVPEHTQLFQQITKGSWPRLGDQHTRRLLIGSPATSTATNKSPGLHRKVLPAISHTRYWPRIQRKILPRYLFVLDDVAAVTLLRTLTRLQPPVIAEDPNDGNPPSASAAGAAGTACRQQQPPARPLAYIAPSSITGAFKRRHHLQDSSASASADDPTAHDAAAVARGFLSAADERRQFELMLMAVFTVFQHKLMHWDGKRLMMLVGYAAQLRVIHHNFMQAWFQATTPLLCQQDGPHLVVCLEALASLQLKAPVDWSSSWAAASRDQLQQLSLQQLAMLLLHVGALQMQMPDHWWREYAACVLQQVESSHGAAGSVPLSQSAVQQMVHVHTRNADDRQGLQQPPAQAQAQRSWTDAGHTTQQETDRQQEQPALSRPTADALCSILWGCGVSSSLPVGANWLECCLNLLLPAIQQHRCSAGAAVQLLHACTFGVCRQLPATRYTSQTCLEVIQLRASKVCSSSALGLLLDCLLEVGRRVAVDQSPSIMVQQQLPRGFCEDLEEALTPVLPAVSTAVLVNIANVFGALQHQPGVQLLSAFVLVTQNHVPGLSSARVAVLVECCTTWGVVMPNVWVASVIRRLGQLVKQQQGWHAGTQQQLMFDVGMDKLELYPGDLERVLTLLPRVAANWSNVLEDHKDILTVLHAYIDSSFE